MGRPLNNDFQAVKAGPPVQNTYWKWRPLQKNDFEGGVQIY
jgi:hypothetical protein